MKNFYLPVFLTTLFLSGWSRATASVWYVNDNSTAGDVYASAVGNNANAGTSAAPFATIAYAISQAVAGDTVFVDVGTYQERITVNKSIILKGAQAGIDARTRTFVSGESILDGSVFSTSPYDAIKIANNVFGVVIDGFEIKNYGGGATANGDGNGISSYCMSTNTIGANDVSILNNYIHDVAYNGIMVGSQNTIGNSMVIQYGWLIQFNKISKYTYAGVELTNVINSAVKDNDIAAPVTRFNDPGDAGVGIEIAARSRAKPSAVDSVTVSGNAISGSFASGSRAVINLLSRAYSSTSNASLTAINVEGNTISAAINVRAAILAVAETRNTGPSVISDLDVLNNTLEGNFTGLVIQDYKNGGTNASHNTVSVTGNYINNSTNYGVYISPATDAAGVSVQNNSFENNTAANLKNDGTDTLAATCNWYDSTAFAYIQSKVAGIVYYIPYLTNGSESDPSPGFQPTGSCNGYPIHVNGSTYDDVQQAIDNGNGKRIYISSGIYTGDADATASGLDVSLLPGNSPGCVTQNGNLSLNNGDSLIIDIEGATVCTQYDKWICNGTVSLGSATLDIVLGFVPSATDTFLIIDNDGSDAISGTFSQGSKITVGAYDFTIQYDAGDGNDVVLYLTPAITCPSDTTLGNDNGVCTAVVNGISPVTSGVHTTVTYVISGATTASGSNDASGVTFNKDTSYVKYVITDGGNNKDSCTFMVVVIDTSAPVFTRPADITVFRDGSCVADTSVGSTGSATNISDNCNSGLQASYRDSVVTGSCSSSLLVNRIWSLVDSVGNAAADQIQLITVLDSTKPTFTAPANTSVYLNASCIADTSIGITGNVLDAADNCSSGLVATYRDSVVAGTCPSNYLVYRIWSLVDSCNNGAADQIQVITVMDTIAPSFTAPGNLTVYKNVSCIADTTVANTGNVTDAADNCSLGIVPVYRDSVVAGSCPGTFTVHRIWSLIDSCNNAAAEQIQVITVLDSIRPTFSRPADVTLYKDGSCQIDSSVSAGGDVMDEYDNCTTGLQATYRDSVVAGSCQGAFIIHRIWSLADSCGNAAADQIQVITVSDTVRPTFSLPADITLYKDASCNADSSITVTGDVSDENDNCSTGLQATYRDSIVGGTCQGSYTIKRIWSLIDSCGNTAADQIQTITVLDSIRPTFTRPADTTLYKDASCLADSAVAVTGSVSDEADNCSTGLQATYRDSIIAGSCQGSYTIKRIWSLADSCGNAAADQIQTITVLDTIRPVITSCPGSTTRKTNPGKTYFQVPNRAFDATATDNCSQGDSISYRFILSGAIDSTGSSTLLNVKLPFGLTTVKWLATDACGNTSDTCVFTVNVDTVVALIGVGDVNVGPSSSQQYSDSVTLSASVAPWPSNPGDPSLLPSGKIVFYLGTERMGEAIVSDTNNPADEIGEASLTVPLLELQSILDYTRYNAGQPTNGPLKPGPKFLTAVFVSFNPVYEGDTTTSEDTLFVTKENALVKVDNSDGYFTVNPTTYKGVVWFRANVADTNDVPLGGRGDIRNATLQFLDGSSYPSTPINGTRNVGLIDPNDKTKGQSVLSFEYQLNNTEIASGGKSWLTWAEAGNYYTGYDNSDMNIVTLGIPGSDFVTGGGHYIMELSGGSFAGATGKKMNFGFNMKWNKSGKNLQGKINVIYRRMVNGQMRIFHIKSNAIGTLAVSSTAFLDADGQTRNYSTASMTSQASLTDITDPANPIGYGGNNNLRVVAWDNKLTGSAGEWDKVAVELLDGKTSQLLFSSYISGGSTRVRTINGGNINVRNTNPVVPPPCSQPTNLNVSSITSTSATLNWLGSTGLRDSVQYRVQGSAAAWTSTSLTTGTNQLPLSSLVPGTIYEWRVLTICTDTTKSSWSNGQFTTTVNCTDAPTGLMTSAITSSSATLKWTAVSAATSYLVEYRLLGSASWLSATVTVNYYDLIGLDDDTTYEWRVTNICSGGPGTNSDTLQFKTPSGCATGNLLASMITASSARLHWDVAPSATGYNLRWKDSSAASTWNEEALGLVNYYDLSSLSAGMEYWFQVQVVCSEGNADWTDTAAFITLAACGTPTNLQTSSISNTSATFKWTAVAGASSYDVRYRILNGTWSGPYNVLTNTYSATSLDDDTTYEWSARANCLAGTGNWSSAVTFKTLKTVTCAAPYALTATTYANKATALLSWSGTSGSSYTLQYKKNTASSWTTVTTATTSYSLSLIKNTTYKWQVTASCLGSSYGPVTGPDFTTGTASTVTSEAASGPEITMLESSMSQLRINAYPNPTSGNFTLSMTGFDEGTVVIRVMDIFGKTVMHTQQYLVRGRGTMPMQFGTNLNGVYVIQVVQKDKQMTLKLMKE